MTQTAATLAAILSEYDFILAIDASGSMQETDMPGGNRRWAYMQETAISFAREVCAIDTDGIGLVVFGGENITSHDNADVSLVKDTLGSRRVGGGTPLAEALQAAFKLAGKSNKKDFVMVFTDGAPNDKTAAADVIKRQANSQETDDACSVLFVQVGKDASAAAYLKSLDDDLKGAKFDIVDAKTMAEAEKFASIAELVTAAIND